jgi:hypothetical protein
MSRANTTMDKTPPTAETPLIILDFEDSSRMFMNDVMIAAAGIPVMMTNAMRQRVILVCVGNTKFQPMQLIATNIAPIIDVTSMILVLSDALIGEARKLRPASDPQLHPASDCV